MFGVLEYLRLAQVRGEGGSPIDLLFASPALVVCGVGWTRRVTLERRTLEPLALGGGWASASSTSEVLVRVVDEDLVARGQRAARA